MLRCIKCSPDWKHIACGDWTGNIRVHDLNNFEEVQCIQAHENEVVCLDYTPSLSERREDEESKYWLASGSRDRLTQIFEVNEGKYEIIAIIEDHSSTITALKFSEEKGHNSQKRIKLITCGADKAIVQRVIDPDMISNPKAYAKPLPSPPDEYIPLYKKEQCKNKIFSMEVAEHSQYLVTGHDKALALY